MSTRRRSRASGARARRAWSSWAAASRAARARSRRRGAGVVVREARQVSSGASGRNGGFALRGAALPYHRAREQLGRPEARALWRLTEDALDTLARLAGDSFRRTGSVRLAVDRVEA